MKPVATATTKSAAAAAASRTKLVFHWFRNGDLRVHDNPALAHSIKLAGTSNNKSPASSAGMMVPIFCFDPTVFGASAITPFGSLKWGSKRAKFLLESVSDLRQNLSKLPTGAAGTTGGLCVAVGEPHTVFDSILAHVTKEQDLEICIVCQEEVLKEERDAVKAVNAVLKKYRPQSKGVETIWGSTMYELKDLPFDKDLVSLPDTFTPFRTKVEKNCAIAKPLPSPKQLPPIYTTTTSITDLLSYVPTLKDLGYTDEQIEFAEKVDPRGVLEFRGGETAALARVKDYIWTKDLLKVYFDTRNGMIGGDYSSKFSPWLAHGCLSARHVAAECQRYEQTVVANKSTYWLVFELLWRDYCKFFCLKHGDSVFFAGGTIGKTDKQWSSFDKNFQAWREGKTGYPLVDANMRELNATGFMSNRGRQNVASFLAIDLNHDWRFGADWFESNLLDYDVYSNWYNWCAAAGMTGGRLNRFNIVKQSKDYDVKGDYVRHWIPELKNVPNEFVHEPWKMPQFQQIQFGCKLGVDYPNPIYPPSRPSERRDGGGGGGGGRKNNNNKNEKQRKPNTSNRNKHQQYEMKSLKQGGYQIKG